MSRGLSDRWNRLNGPARIGGIDLARGLAVVGMFAAHLLVTAERWIWTDPASWSSIVDGRSSILFATLAGVSIGLVSGGPVPMSGDGLRVVRGRLAVRAGLLWVIGILLILTGVPVYVILPAYAILFLLALPFLRLRAGILLATAAILGTLMAVLQPMLNVLPIWFDPWATVLSAVLGWNYPFTLWIAFVLAGLGLARAGLGRFRVQLWMLAAGTVVSAMAYAAAELPIVIRADYLAMVWQATPHESGLWELFGSGGFAIAVIGGCLLLCRVDVMRMLLLPLRATGAMPLTAYTAQLLVWAAVSLEVFGDTGDLGGFRSLEPFWPMTIGVVGFCTVWALLIGRGPLEWVLDRTARFAVPGSGRRIARLEA